MTPRQKLWQHLHDEYGLLLLESELDEIIMLAKEIIESYVLSESNNQALPRLPESAATSEQKGNKL